MQALLQLQDNLEVIMAVAVRVAILHLVVERVLAV
jgi:hypothetical protein